MLEDHPDCSLAYLWGVSVGSCHDSILSYGGVSGNPGAIQGVVQGLLSTCRLQGVDPYTYLVDVLQQVQGHPASAVAELTPRVWKQKFAADPLRSDLDRVGG